jgi:hypothetical protein
MTAPIDLESLRAALAVIQRETVRAGGVSFSDGRDLIATHAAVSAALAELTTRRARDAEVEALVEVVSDLLSSHPKASTYPDGPCIEKQTRDELVAAMKPFTGAKS